MDRIKVLLGLILVFTFGCSSGEQNNTGQKPGGTNAHYSLTGTVENGTAAITPDLTSYPAGTPMTIEITPDDGDVFYAWSGDPSGTENPLVVTMDGVITVGAVCTSAIYHNYCTEADQFLIIYDGDSGAHASNWGTGKNIIDENNLRKGRS